MKKKDILLTALAMGAIATSAIAAETKTEGHHMGKDPMNMELQKLSGMEFEMAFLSDMVHHHKAALDMFKMAEQRAQHEEIKQLAKNGTAEQQGEIDKMSGMLKAMGKTADDHQEPAESMSKMKADMAKLDAAKGAEFDKMFLMMMIEHHHGAIHMAELASEKSSNAEIKPMAEKMAASQREEVKKMKDWQKAWFGGEKSS